MDPQPATTYRESGVDIDAKMEAVRSARPAIEATWGKEVVGAFGGFGGLFRMPAGLDDPLLCASADGVGTKIRVAIAAGRHDTVGEDLVNHCVNDILVQGARPLFVLDYIAVGKMDPALVRDLLAGFARGCKRNGCALLGGETAEMPGTYPEGDYDLAATIVGVVERKRLLPRPGVRAGDALVGVPSSGLHTNGYSLARKVLFDKAGLRPSDRMKELEGRTVAEALLAVHRSYAPLLLPLLDRDWIKAMAHITGGGFPDNVPRVLPEGLRAVVASGAWEPPPIFRMIRDRGGVAPEECYRVLNMGMGMVLVVDPTHVDALLHALEQGGEPGARPIGHLEEGPRSCEVRFRGRS